MIRTQKDFNAHILIVSDKAVIKWKMLNTSYDIYSLYESD